MRSYSPRSSRNRQRCHQLWCAIWFAFVQLPESAVHEFGALLGAALHHQRVRDGVRAPRAFRFAIDGVAAAPFRRCVVACLLVGEGTHRLEVGEVRCVRIPRRRRPFDDVAHPLALAAPEQFELRQTVGDDVTGVFREIGFQQRDTTLQFAGVGNAHRIRQRPLTW